MSKDISPDVIAQSFIKQYYEMMAKTPGELHKFYHEDSNFLFSENTQKCETIHGTEAIREQIGRLNLAGAVFDLVNGSVDAQSSENNGYLIAVTGLYTPSWKPEIKAFTQSFFLAKKSTTYFVLNSVFRVVQDVRYPHAMPPLGAQGQGSPHPSNVEAQAYYAAVQAAANGYAHPHFLAPPPPMLPIPMPPLVVHRPEYGHAGGHFQHGPAPTVAPPAYIATPPESPRLMEEARRSLSVVGETIVEDPVAETAKDEEEPTAICAVTPVAEEAEAPAATPAAVAAKETAPVAAPAAAAPVAAPAPAESTGGKSYADMAKRVKAAAAASASAAPAAATTAAPGTAQPANAGAKQQAPRVVVTSTVQQNNQGAGKGQQNKGGNNNFQIRNNGGNRGVPSAVKPAAPAASSAPSAGGEGGASNTPNVAPAINNNPVFTLYVSQLPENATLSEMRNMFSQYGDIRSIDLPVNRTFAFVKYDTAEGMNNAIANAKSITYQGKPLRMEERTLANSGHKNNNGGNKWKPLQQNTRLQGLMGDKQQQKGGNNKQPQQQQQAQQQTATA